MINLTENEKKVLEAIPKDDFYEEGLDSILWTDYFLDTVKGYFKMDSKTTRAILSSLIKKEIIFPIEFSKKESTIGLTKKGKELMKELGYEE